MKPVFPLLLIILLLIPMTSFADTVERKKKILVLHSYHQGLEWTDNVTRGIRSVLDPLHQSYEIHYDYLDTKRNTGKDYIDKVSRFISEKNRLIRYEIIIVSDNNALKLLNDGKIVFNGNPPIIFCGINNYDKGLTDHLERVAGVAETTDHRGTIDLMMKLHPRRNHVLVVLDRTATGDAIREEFRKFEEIYKEMLDFEFMRDFSLEDIPEKLSSLNDSDIIYILTFNRDTNGNFISYAEGIEMFSRTTNAPIYGSWDFYLGKGIIGGRITSGYRQGEEAAKIAVKILQGYEIRNMKVVLDSPTQYMFDYRYLQEYGIDQSQLPEGSRIINAPPTSYEKFKPFLVGVTGVSLVVVLLLSWKYARQQAILEEKMALAIELEKKVYERTGNWKKSTWNCGACQISTVLHSFTIDAISTMFSARRSIDCKERPRRFRC